MSRRGEADTGRRAVADSTVRYLGIEVDDALNIAEQIKF
jgi:hypothetical protein